MAAGDTFNACGAALHIGDDNGDGHATMRCAESSGHELPHRETYVKRGGGQRVEITWTLDDRDECAACHSFVELADFCEDCKRDLCDRCFGRKGQYSILCGGCQSAICASCMIDHQCEET